MKRNPRAGQGEKKDGTKAENGNGCSINNGINRKQKPGNAAQDRRGETHDSFRVSPGARCVTVTWPARKHLQSGLEPWDMLQTLP